jgi:hypothetical protein
MGKAHGMTPPMPVGANAVYEDHYNAMSQRRIVEGRTEIPRVIRCGSCGAGMKGNTCDHCGSEHK